MLDWLSFVTDRALHCPSGTYNVIIHDLVVRVFITWRYQEQHSHDACVAREIVAHVLNLLLAVAFHLFGAIVYVMDANPWQDIHNHEATGCSTLECVCSSEMGFVMEKNSQRRMGYRLAHQYSYGPLWNARLSATVHHGHLSYSPLSLICHTVLSVPL